MANIKIAQLTNKTSLADTDVVIVESATQTMKMSVGKLKELLGIQRGGIVESGSNANGSYIKYADGTMICHFVLPCSYNSAIRLRGIWTFPTSFMSPPIITVTKDYSTSTPRQINSSAHVSARTTTTATIDLVQIVTTSGTALVDSWQSTDVYGATCVAIGRWK